MDCVALMIAVENGKEIYVTVQMELGSQRPPENTPEDIKRCVDLFNDGTAKWTYIDMFGIMLDGVVHAWEEEEVG